MVFNVTALDAANNILEYALALNTLTDKLIGMAIILIVTMITFIYLASRTRNTFMALGGAGFIGTLSCMMLLPMGLITFELFQIVFSLTAIAIAVGVLTKE